MFKIIESARPGDLTVHVFRDEAHFFEFMKTDIDSEFDPGVWESHQIWIDPEDVRWEAYHDHPVWDHTV